MRAHTACPASVEQLAQHACINFRFASGRVFEWEFKVDGVLRKVAPRGWLCFNDADLVLQAVLDGEGLAQMAGYQVCEHLRAGRLVACLPQYAPDDRGHYLCYLSRHQLPLRIRVFVDYMTQQIRALDLHCLVDLLPAAPDCCVSGSTVAPLPGLAPRDACLPTLESSNNPNQGETMKIVIIGGTGLIGSKLVRILRERGHEALAASPNSGVNTMTGEGLDAALAGADIVVDVANSPSFADDAVLDFFTTSGRNLLAAAARAGVRHHVALSVVGTDRLAESGYFRAKIAQEEADPRSGLPYTIVHATQFFEFLGGIAASAAAGDTIHLSPAYIQPISSDDVALAVADFTLGAPSTASSRSAGRSASACPTWSSTT
jgi:hypothetical protein